VSKDSERTSGTVRSRSHPDSVGVASRAWVQRSNVGPISRAARATHPCRTES
jgi:hypothetical protein